MKKIFILAALLLMSAISYAQIPHKTRDSLQIDKIRVNTRADSLLVYNSNKIVGFISYTDFVTQLNATGLAGGGGGTDYLPLTNIWTGTSNTFNNGIYIGTSLSPLVVKGNADYSLNIGSSLYGGGGTGSYKQVTIGQWSNLAIQTTDSWVSTDYLFVAGNGTGSGGLASNAFWLKKNGDGYFAGTVVGDPPTLGSHFVTKDYGDTYYLGGTATGLEILDEGNGNGWRLIGRNPLNYGNLGLDAIDFSISSGASSTRGSTGSRAFSSGYDITNSGNDNGIFGNSNSGSGNNGLMFGNLNSSTFDNNLVGGNSSTGAQTGVTAIGTSVTGAGQWSSVFGVGGTSYSFGEYVIGTYPSIYTPDNAIAFDADDRIFNVGIGASSGARADAFTVYKNGSVWMPVYGGGTVTGTPAYNLVVDANGKLITDALSAGGGGDLVAANNLSDLVSVPTALINLGLDNVDNTADLSKPISTATQTQLDLKETIAQRTVVTASPYTTVLADDGKSIELNPGASTVTLDDTGIPVKFRQSIFNDTGGNVTISIAGGDTSKQTIIPLPDVGYAYVELMETNVWSVIIGSGTPGDMVLANAQIVSGSKTFLNSTFLMRNVANTFSATFTNTNTGTRTYTLQDADGTIAFSADIPVVATFGEVDTGTDNAKFISPSALANSQIQGDVTALVALSPLIIGSTIATAVPSQVITLAAYGGTIYETPEWNATYTVAASPTARTFTKVAITTTGQTVFPSVTGATLRPGAAFVATQVFDMVVATDDGTDVYYYFLARQ